MEFDLAFDDLDQQTVHNASARRNLLENVSAFPLFLDRLADTLQLPLNSIHTSEKLFLLLDGMLAA
jgi:hypothetical protein